ncbi:hypothetical protein [Catellatospora methionotrophica]|uniref:hypothetical protein n=1 Tax=Catellatospora methionotrophica TaxID=121620 RepID=UPI0033E1B80E
MLTSTVEPEPLARTATAVAAIHVDFDGLCAGCLDLHDIATWWPCTVRRWAERVAQGAQ